jgi:D-alanine-D-alanine ligase
MTDITVLTGGSTPERDVAFAGAAQVVDALRDLGHTVTVVDTVHGTLATEQERDYLVPTVGKQPPSEEALADLARQELGPALVTLPEISHAALVFPVLHGRQGEGGEIQSLLDGAGVPYAGSGPLGSALAMDKDLAKRLFRYAGIPTADWAMWPADLKAVTALGLPLIVKPSRVGSTVGLSVIDRPDDLPQAVEEAGRYDDEVILEAFAPGREFTVGILGTEALAVGEIIPRHAIFDYECKYTPGMTEEIFPADVSRDLETLMRKLALYAHRSLKLRDFSRVDFRLADDGTPVCLEVNTLPGLTATSLLPQSAAARGIGFAELCDRICHFALERSADRNKARVPGL